MEFPSEKKCSYCKIIKDKHCFYIVNGSRDGIRLHSQCKNCEKNIEKELKNKLFELLGKECSSCGIKDLRVLEINHINHKIKDKRLLTRKITKASRRTRIYLKEINNIELLCANCHRIRTWETIWSK